MNKLELETTDNISGMSYQINLKEIVEKINEIIDLLNNPNFHE